MNDSSVRASRTRRRLKLAAIGLSVLALIVLIVIMLGGGDHGPMRHFSGTGVW